MTAIMADGGRARARKPKAYAVYNPATAVTGLRRKEELFLDPDTSRGFAADRSQEAAERKEIDRYLLVLRSGAKFGWVHMRAYLRENGSAGRRLDSLRATYQLDGELSASIERLYHRNRTLELIMKGVKLKEASGGGRPPELHAISREAARAEAQSWFPEFQRVIAEISHKNQGILATLVDRPEN